MSALQRLFNYELNQSSPVFEETVRVVDHDEDGNEYVSYVPFDSAAFQKSLGSVTDWSLDSLIKAGIDPKFNIHTSNPTSLEGTGSISSWSQIADEILAENSVE